MYQVPRSALLLLSNSSPNSTGESGVQAEMDGSCRLASRRVRSALSCRQQSVRSNLNITIQTPLTHRCFNECIFSFFKFFRYNQWSPPAQSNETSNGYFLERSHSARLTLEKSIELCPEEEVEGDDSSVVNSAVSSTAQVLGNANVGVGSGNSLGLTGTDDTNETIPPPSSLVSDESSTNIVKSQTLTRTPTSVSQPRPGHAQVASPRPTAPPSNPNMSIPRSSSTQFSPLHPNRPQQPPVKNEGTGSQSAPSPNN